MLDDALTDDAPEFHRHRVANKVPEHLKSNGIPVAYKGVPEPAVSESIELRGQRRRRLVVLHATVYAGVRLARPLPVALGNEVLQPIPPRATRL